MVLFLFGTINESNAQLDTCCCFSTPSTHKHNLSTFLVRVSCVLLTLGKLGHGVLFIPFIERRPAFFSAIKGAIERQLILNEEAAVTPLTVCT
jgi:hypothetical protein